MRKAVSMAHLGLTWVVLAAVVAQFFFAGLGAFGAASYSLHRTNGYLIVLGALLLLLLALAGWLGRARIGLSALLFALTIVQVVLATAVPPTLAALHPVNALAILGVTAQLARRGAPSRAPAPRPAPAPRGHELGV